MFSPFDYLSSILSDIPGIKSIQRASSVGQLEEVLSNFRNLQTPCLVVKDSADGYLNLRDRRFSSGYYSFYIFDRSSLNDSDARLKAKQTSLELGIALIDRMKLDAEDYGQPAYGLDDTRIDYSEIGPIASGCYGYSFGFNINNEF